jgi:hypothetical protein
MKRSSLCVCLFLAAAAAPTCLTAQIPTFSSIHQISTGVANAENSSLLLSGNFNGDGNTDLIVGVTSAANAVTTRFLTGDGKGNFTVEGPANPALQTPGSVSLVADVDGHGKDDIISLVPGCQGSACNNADGPNGTLTVFLSRGEGNFTPGFIGTLPPGLNQVEGVVGDFNHDGKPDVAVLEYVTSFSGNPPPKRPAMLVIFINQGGGIFAQTTYQTPESLWANFTNVTNMVTGDFEGNGNQDIALVFDTGMDPSAGTPNAYPEVLTFAGNGKGAFGPGVVSYTFDSLFPFFPQGDLFAGDLNGDGRTDLVIGIDGKPAAGKALRVPSLLAKVSGKFYWSSAVYLDTSLGGPAIVVSDLNGDGIPDLLFFDPPFGGASPQTAHAGFYLGLGNGAFKTPHTPVTFSFIPTPNHGSIAAVPLKKGAPPSLFFFDTNLPDIQMRINTTKQ